MKVKREIDRLPHPQRTDHTRHARPHLLAFLVGNIGKDDRYSRKHLVTVLHRELKHWIGNCNDNVQLKSAISTMESLCHALPINLLIESRVFDRCSVEINSPWNPSTHRGF